MPLTDSSLPRAVAGTVQTLILAEVGSYIGRSEATAG